jgi:O-antigen/teichoic acid export membrane protein
MNRSVLLSIVDQAMISAFNLVLNLAFISFASPAQFGRFAFVLAGTFFASSAQNALVIMPLNYLLPGRAAAEADARLSMLTSANLALTLLVLPAGVGLGLLVDADPLLISAIAAYFLTVMIREYARNIMVVKGRIHRTLIYDAAAIVFSALTAPVLWRWTEPEAAVLAALTIGNLASFCVCRFDLKTDLGRLPGHLAAYREIWRDTRWALQGALQNEVMVRSYVFLVERMRDTAALGRLNAGRVALSPLLLIGSAWCRVARPRMVEALHRDEVSGIAGILASGLAITVGATVLYGLVLVLAWPIIEGYAFRHRYGDMETTVFYWWIYAAALGPTSVMSALMEARRQFRVLAAIGFGCAVLILVAISGVLVAGFDASAAVLVLAGVAVLEFSIFVVLTGRWMASRRCPPGGAADLP